MSNDKILFDYKGLSERDKIFSKLEFAQIKGAQAKKDLGEGFQIVKDPKHDFTHLVDEELHVTVAEEGSNFLYHAKGKDNRAFNGAFQWPGIADLKGGNIIPQAQGAHQTIKFDPFNQETVISRLDQNLPNLNQANSKHGGLCDIICNYVVMNRMLDQDKSAQHPLDNANPLDEIKRQDIIQKLETDVAPLHILKQVSIFQILKAALFNKIPHNILDSNEQKKLLRADKKNEGEIKDSLSVAVDKMPTDRYIKFITYNKDGLNFSGHSMLVKRNKDGTFTFFDPNEGSKTYSKKQDLINKLYDKQLECRQTMGYKNICFVDVEKMLPKNKAEEKPEQSARKRNK